MITNNLYYDYYLTPKNMQYDELVFQFNFRAQVPNAVSDEEKLQSRVG